MDSFKPHSESGYNLQRNTGQQNDVNRQQLRSYGQNVIEGSLRRPIIISNNDLNIDCLSQQTNSLSLNERPNVQNYNSIANTDVEHNTLNWMSSSENKAQQQLGQSSQSCSSISNSTLRTPNSGDSQLSPYAKEFVPRMPSAMCYSNTPSNGVRMWSNYSENDSVNRDFDDFIALSYLREFIDTITIKPNKYDSGIAYLTEVINSYIDEDDSVMQTVVNIIVDQAIIDPQFRYNGVRLCIYFMQYLRALSPETTFKLLLFKRCQREHSRRNTLIKSSDGGETYLRGLTMFIGDLYSRCSAHELAEYLPQLLLTLMSNPHKENLKCVCQVLKLCGSNLENYYKNERKSDDMELVMEQMKASLNNTDISVYVKELITNIIEMQSRGWTASLIPTTPIVNPYLNTNYTENNTTNPTDFYEEYNSYSDEEEFQTSYDFGHCGDEEDNEVCEAFEEFLKNSGQSK